MRLAEPVRDLSDQQAALERLVKSGEIVLGDADEEDASDDGNDTEDDDEEEAGG
jgi:chromosome partition protein MukE